MAPIQRPRKLTAFEKKMKIIKALLEGMLTKRCHVMPIVGDASYTVGQHTANALVLLYALYPGGEPSHQLVKALLHHDVVERFLGDMPRPAKWLFPELGEAYAKAEAEMERRLGIKYKLTKDEQIWLRSIDSLELWVWSVQQCHLGNTNTGYWMSKLYSVLTNEKKTPVEVKLFMQNYKPDYLREMTYDGK